MLSLDELCHSIVIGFVGEALLQPFTEVFYGLILVEGRENCI